MSFNKQIDDLRFVKLKSWVLSDVWIRFSSIAVFEDVGIRFVSIIVDIISVPVQNNIQLLHES